MTHTEENDFIYIFLDVDGVLNKSSQWKRMFQLDNRCIQSFALYVSSLPKPVRVVLTSTWNLGYDEAGNHSEQVRDLLSRLRRYGINIVGKTYGTDGKNRAQEINEYIASHGLSGKRSIAIDDDESLFPAETQRHFDLILTNADTGFTEKDTEQANVVKSWWQRLFDE